MRSRAAAVNGTGQQHKRSLSLSGVLSLPQRHPLLLQTAVGLGLAASGDVLAQRLQWESVDPFQLDPSRLRAYSILGALWTGPFNYHWLPWLARVIPADGYVSIVKKVAVQQLVCNPLMQVAGRCSK